MKRAEHSHTYDKRAVNAPDYKSTVKSLLMLLDRLQDDPNGLQILGSTLQDVADMGYRDGFDNGMVYCENIRGEGNNRGNKQENKQENKENSS